MRKHNYPLVILCVLFLFQLAVPVYMITNREITLKHGTSFKFQTTPVDPYDAFKGKYVALSIKENTIALPKNLKVTRNQNVYVSIIEDEQGFAKVSGLSLACPKHNEFVKAKVRYVTGNNVQLDFPFDRYYLDEFAAPEAEKVYRKFNRRGAKKEAYITVKVRKGNAVIEGLFLDGRPVLEAVNIEKQ